jgi:hypothetical protein
VSASSWKGEAITIQNDSVDFVAGNAGTVVTVDASATQVTAVATFTARADDTHQSDAAQSIADAKGKFKLDRFAVDCPHGESHGTSRSGSAGCKQLKVTVPAGLPTLPLDLHVIDYNGGIVVSGEPVAKSFVIEERGTGTVDVRVRPVKGATIVVRAGFAVRISLPSDFSADRVSLHGGHAAPDIDTTAFPGLADNTSFGKTGEGAAVLDVSTSDLGTIVFARF